LPWLIKAGCGAGAKGTDSLAQNDAEKISLRQPHLQSHLVKVARTCVASQLNLSQLYHMNLRFKHYDVSGDGRLSYGEMLKVMEDIGVTAADDVEVIIDSLDSDRSGMIEYTEFIAGCIDISAEHMKHHLHIAFSIFDLDGSGAITLQELRHVLTADPSAEMPSCAALDVNALLPDGLTVEELMRELDADRGGTITYDEFERYILAEHEKVARHLESQEEAMERGIVPEAPRKRVFARGRRFRQRTVNGQCLNEDPSKEIVPPIKI